VIVVAVVCAAIGLLLAIVAFGVRIFNNAASIRRHYL
jgi:small basic protein